MDHLAPQSQLLQLAVEILDAHQAYLCTQQSALLHVKRAGDLLNEVKERLAHGDWLLWLETNCPEISKRTAQGYMRIAREWSRLVELAGSETRVSLLPIRDALALLVDEWTDANELGIGGNGDGPDDGPDDDDDGLDPDRYPKCFQIYLDARAMRAFRAKVAALRRELHTSNNTDTVVRAITICAAVVTSEEVDDANDSVDRVGRDARL